MYSPAPNPSTTTRVLTCHWIATKFRLAPQISTTTALPIIRIGKAQQSNFKPHDPCTVEITRTPVPVAYQQSRQSIHPVRHVPGDAISRRRKQKTKNKKNKNEPHHFLLYMDTSVKFEHLTKNKPTTQDVAPHQPRVEGQ